MDLTPKPLVPDTRSAQIVAGLATLYHRHNDPVRALALGIMALKYGADTPATALLVASCFLKTGDAEQADAALMRLEGRELSQDEQSAARFLSAKIQYRLGNYEAAQKLLSETNS